MGWKLTEAFVQIGAPLGKLSNDLKQAKSKVASAMESIANISRKAGIGLSLVGAAITGGSAVLIKFAATAEESENLFEVAMKGMADSAREWSDDLSTALGLNAFEVRKMIGTFNFMFKAMGIGAERAAEMSQGLTQIAFDMSSFFDIKPAEAFDKLRAGIIGEIEPLRRLGILLNESVIAIDAQNTGYEGSLETISEVEKVQLRYNSILRQTTDAQGDLERTLGSATNQLRSMKQLFAITAVELGTALLPLVTNLTSKVRIATILFKNWATENRELVARILPVVAALGALALVLGPILIALPTIVSAFALLGTAAIAMAGPMGLVALALAGVAAFVIPWSSISDSFKELSIDTKTTSDNLSTIGGDNQVKQLAFDIGAVATETKKVAENLDLVKKSLPAWGKSTADASKVVIDSMGNVTQSVVGEGGVLNTIVGSTETTNAFFNAINNVAMVTAQGMAAVGAASRDAAEETGKAAELIKPPWIKALDELFEENKDFFAAIKREAKIYFESIKDFLAVLRDAFLLFATAVITNFVNRVRFFLNLLRGDFDEIKTSIKALRTVFVQSFNAVFIDPFINKIKALRAEVQSIIDFFARPFGGGTNGPSGSSSVPSPTVPSIPPPGFAESARATISVTVNVNGTAGEDPERFSERVVNATLDAVRRGKFNRAVRVPGMA